MEDKKLQQAYLKGYKEGFMSALKVAWALAEELYLSVTNVDKEKVLKMIDKLRN